MNNKYTSYLRENHRDFLKVRFFKIEAVDRRSGWWEVGEFYIDVLELVAFNLKRVFDMISSDFS